MSLDWKREIDASIQWSHNYGPLFLVLQIFNLCSWSSAIKLDWDAWGVFDTSSGNSTSFDQNIRSNWESVIISRFPVLSSGNKFWCISKQSRQRNRILKWSRLKFLGFVKLSRVWCCCLFDTSDHSEWFPKISGKFLDRLVRIFPRYTIWPSTIDHRPFTRFIDVDLTDENQKLMFKCFLVADVAEWQMTIINYLFTRRMIWIIFNFFHCLFLCSQKIFGKPTLVSTSTCSWTRHNQNRRKKLLDRDLSPVKLLKIIW